MEQRRLKACVTPLLMREPGDEAVLDMTAAFLKEQGRMKYLRPLYRALYKSSIGKDTALKTFEEARLGYHPIAAKMVASDLRLAI